MKLTVLVWLLSVAVIYFGDEGPVWTVLYTVLAVVAIVAVAKLIKKEAY